MGIEPSYYDIPMLKRPVWRWEVASYFFFGGLSAGAFLLARTAERFGDPRYREVSRAGTYVAALAALPCAPLLIKDLGDRTRFHHMLRVWKPGTPMNLGAWTLTAYSAVVGLATLRQLGRSRHLPLPESRHPVRRSAGQGIRRALEVLPRGSRLREAPVRSRADRAVGALSDAAGAPLAVLLAGYSGVLLSGTSNPIWSRNTWLGALFSAGAFHNGASAVHLAHSLHAGSREDGVSKSLERLDTVTAVAETVALAGYLGSLGRLGEPLTRGKVAPSFWGGAVGAGMVLPELLKRIPAAGQGRRWLKVAASAVALVGGLALRWAVVYAGQASAADPAAARYATRGRSTG